MGDQRDPYEVLQVHPSAVPQVIEAAYRALARLHHPDRSRRPNADATMAELNRAYAELRDPERRSAHDRARGAGGPAGGGLSHRMQAGGVEQRAARRNAVDAGSVVIDFGRYAGQTLSQVARADPRYLEWLKRHSAGLRYRRQIDEALSSRVTARR